MHKQPMAETKGFTTMMKYLGRNRFGQSLLRAISQTTDRPKSMFHSLKKRNITVQPKEDFPKLQIFLHKNSEQSHRLTISDLKIRQSAMCHSNRYNQSKSTLHPRKTLGNRQQMERQFSNSSKYKSAMLDRTSITLQQTLKNRQELLKYNKLDELIAQLSGSNNVDSARIYRDKFRKFYNQRLVRQKLTSFFQYEYIQDYASQLRLLETLLSLTIIEIYQLCFYIMDQNDDGLLCNQDLFALSINQRQNELINKDIYRIYQHVALQQNPRQGVTIIDAPDENEVLKGDGVTYTKVKLAAIRIEKGRASGESVSRDLRITIKLDTRRSSNQESQGVKLTRRMNRHLFSFQPEDDSGQAAIKQLRKRFAEIQRQSKANYKFKINFSRYRTIFHNTIPELYYDILFMQGAVSVPGKVYAPLNYDLEDPKEEEPEPQEIDKLEFFRQKLTKMRQMLKKHERVNFSLPYNRSRL